MDQTHQWMQQALSEARRALEIDETPVGAIVVQTSSGLVIGRAHNRRQIDRDPTAHAEILAIRQAAQFQGDWRLTDCTIVVTLEPCPMCAGAIVNARIPRLIYGCDDPKAGAVRSLYQLCQDSRLNHHVDVVAGVLAEQCAQLLRDFFRRQRQMGKK